MCTIFPMVLTNSITPSCSTSVVSVNCRMSQNPKIATTFLPGIIGSISPPRRMFAAMISEPASPNPTASNPQIFAMEFSKSRVSICESSRVREARFASRFRLRRAAREKNPKAREFFSSPPRRKPSARFSKGSSSAGSSSESLFSSTANRLSGFSETSRTFLTMRSMGFKTRACASRLKNSAPAPSITHTNTVRHMFSAACVLVETRASKNAYDGDEPISEPEVWSTYAASRNSSQRSLEPKSAPGSANDVLTCTSRLSPYTTSAYRPSAARQYWSTAP